LDWKKEIPIVPLKKFNKKEKYDLVIATFWATVSLLDKINADRKLYFVQQDERNFYNKKENIKKVEATYRNENIEFMTMAGWIQDWLKDEFGKDSYYVPNGIDLSIFKPGQSRIVKVPRVLIEGKIHIPSKGVAEAYDLISKFPCEKWMVSGDGRKPAEWKIDKFFMELIQKKMAEVYQNCDVMLKMSRVESFALPPLEMMACGGTAIIRKVNGIEDYAVNGYNCLIVDNYQEAEAALVRVINDRKFLKDLKRNALKTAQKWSIDNQKKYLEAIIKKEIRIQDKKSSVSNEYISKNVNGAIATIAKKKSAYRYSHQNILDNCSKHDLIQSLENHKKYIKELEAVNSKNQKIISRLLKELDTLNKMIFAIRGSKIWKVRNKIVKYLGRGPL
jgi:glycosyltransferase involved in cell wall biosynthesis